MTCCGEQYTHEQQVYFIFARPHTDRKHRHSLPRLARYIHEHTAFWSKEFTEVIGSNENPSCCSYLMGCSCCDWRSGGCFRCCSTNRRAALLRCPYKSGKKPENAIFILVLFLTNPPIIYQLRPKHQKQNDIANGWSTCVVATYGHTAAISPTQYQL